MGAYCGSAESAHRETAEGMDALKLLKEEANRKRKALQEASALKVSRWTVW